LFHLLLFKQFIYFTRKESPSVYLFLLRKIIDPTQNKKDCLEYVIDTNLFIKHTILFVQWVSNLAVMLDKVLEYLALKMLVILELVVTCLYFLCNSFNVITSLAFFVICLPDNIIFAAPYNSLLGTFGSSSFWYTNHKGISWT